MGQNFNNDMPQSRGLQVFVGKDFFAFASVILAVINSVLLAIIMCYKRLYKLDHTYPDSTYLYSRIS